MHTPWPGSTYAHAMTRVRLCTRHYPGLIVHTPWPESSYTQAMTWIYLCMHTPWLGSTYAHAMTRVYLCPRHDSGLLLHTPWPRSTYAHAMTRVYLCPRHDSGLLWLNNLGLTLHLKGKVSTLIRDLERRRGWHRKANLKDCLGVAYTKNWNHHHCTATI